MKSTLDGKEIIQLEFEKPLNNISAQIKELEEQALDAENKKIISDLKTQYEKVKAQVYKNVAPIDVVKIARHPQRPHPQDYIKYLSGTFFEMHGDRSGADDQAICGGLIEIDGQTVMIVMTQKGRNLKDNKKRNFGMPSPEGYRKAMRLFEHAEKFGMPIITLIDTPGAYPGLEAETKNQSQAIAMNLRVLAGLTVPVIAVITGEGGSGGALALGVANRVLMLENSIYSVISPEGCAAILWRTRDKSADAAKALKITSKDLTSLGVADGVVEEVVGGAHYNPEETGENLLAAIKAHLKELNQMTPEEVKADRQKKIRNLGKFLEN